MIVFEWDKTKAEINRRKHGVDFHDATEVFYDPSELIEQDRVVDGEIRWRTTGLVAGVLVVQVAHTVNEQSGVEVI